MSLLDTLKSMIGLDGSKSGDRQASEQGEPDVGSEKAVKRTNSGAAAGADASASTETLAEEPPKGIPEENDPVASATEPGEAAGPNSQVEGSADATTVTGDMADGDDKEVVGPDANAADGMASTNTDSTVEADEGETAAAGTDASGSTGSVTEEPPKEDIAAEPSEVAGPGSQSDISDVSSDDGTQVENVDDSPVTEEVDTVGGDEEDENTLDVSGEEDPSVANGDDDGSEVGDEDVKSISGVGPAYASQLNEVGIQTVSDLVSADPEELADQTDVSEKRIGRWIDRAED